jgi:hypothetical protein
MHDKKYIPMFPGLPKYPPPFNPNFLTCCPFNPNPCGWGRIWLPKLWRGILSNGLSIELENLCIPRKTSREYILLSTCERKMAFLAIYKPKREQNRPFFRRFRLFQAALKVYLTSVIPSTTTPGPGSPPPIVGAPSNSGAAHAVSSSF